MGEWKECKLGDVADIICGATPSTSNPDYWADEILWITAKDISESRGYKISDTERKISKLGFENCSTVLLPPLTTVLIARGATMGKTALLAVPMTLNQTCYAIVSNTNDLDKCFLFYSIKNMFDYFSTIAHGAIFNTVIGSSLRETPLLLPELPEQRAIASMLSSLDDKIDLLHRQNKTLEAMAETLFRQWFVEEADEGWEEKVITEIFEVRDGTHDSPKQKDTGKPLITSKHILDNRLDIENAYLISDEDFEEVNRRSKVDTNDILFSMIGTLGLLYLEQSTDVNYAIKNIGLFKTSQNPKWVYYTFLWLKSSFGRDFIHEYRSGSTQEYISLGSLRSIIFIIPPIEILNEFNLLVEPIFNKRKRNINQIRTLEILRDTLLPKLMSGEVRVDV